VASLDQANGELPLSTPNAAGDWDALIQIKAMFAVWIYALLPRQLLGESP